MSAGHDTDKQTDRKPAAEDNGNGNGHHNGNGKLPPIGDFSFFLPPLLANDQLPYLVNGDGNPVDADGNVLDEQALQLLPKAIRELQQAARPRREPADL